MAYPKNYYVDIVLGVNFSEKNIFKVLKKGAELGFMFYDHTACQKYEESFEINYQEAFEKIRPIALFHNSEERRCIFTRIKNHHFANLWFSRYERYLNITLNSFLPIKVQIDHDPEIKETENITCIDFKYYIDIATALADDFGIENFDADYIK